MTKIIRAACAMERVGLKKTAFYGRVQKGLIPPPIKIGKRAAGWLDQEIDEVIGMFVAGLPEMEIQSRVQGLLKNRKCFIREG